MNADSSAASVSIIDAFGVISDPRMPFLNRALDPQEAQVRIGACLAKSSDAKVGLQAIRVRRYKPERRCLIEYELWMEQGGVASSVLVLGKARAKSTDLKTFRLHQALWRNGFDSTSADGIIVAEPLGVVPEFHMWLQRKVPGLPASDLLADRGGVLLARRISDAARKLHQSRVPATRRHTIDDELEILSDRLGGVNSMKPEWQGRLERLLANCIRLARRLPEPKFCGIHRDFYPAQVMVDGSKICMTDFDLYCEGDPALDIGNFVGHMTEQSLRCYGDANAMRDQEIAMEERYVELTGEAGREAIRSYATLTLARHIFISTLFAERRPFTARLLDLCEERLASA